MSAPDDDDKPKPEESGSVDVALGDGTPKAVTDYEWYADPVNSETGTRHFCADQRKVIRGSDVYSGHNCLVFGSEL